MAPRHSKAPRSSAPDDVFAVIMAGGSGTRFWPLSRSSRPKQFLALTSKHSLLEETVRRLRGVAVARNTFVVCGQRHAKAVRTTAPSLNATNILMEPSARNTAPAIALAALHLARLNPRGVAVVLPADQHVAQPGAFRASLQEAIAVARQGFIVTLGIRPTRPETGYGYIRQGTPLSATAHRVGAFVEKPDVATAQRYLSSGNYLWNAGIFVFRVDVMREALARHLPETDKPLQALFDALGTKRAAAALKREFPKLPAISIDYAVAEKASNMAVVPAECGWSDVGSFNALPEVRTADERGNVTQGSALVIDSSGCIVLADQRLLSVVGMKDVVVVDSGDAVLVLPKDKCQDVRKVVEALKAGKLTQYL